MRHHHCLIDFRECSDHVIAKACNSCFFSLHTYLLDWMDTKNDGGPICVPVRFNLGFIRNG